MMIAEFVFTLVDFQSDILIDVSYIIKKCIDIYDHS